MATYYVRTDGSDGASGANDSTNPTTGAWLTLSKAASTVAAGDTVYVRASAGNASSYPTSSLDYNPGTYFTPTAGSAGSGFVRWIGYNGRPTIGAPGLLFYATAYQWFENLYIVATGNGAASFGIINGSEATEIRDCVLNLNNQSSLVGIKCGGLNCTNVEIYGGTTSPTLSSGAYAIYSESYCVNLIGCTIRYCRDHGIYISGGSHGTAIQNCQIYKNVGDGINHNSASVVLSSIVNNTIDANKGHGIKVNGTNGAAWLDIKNNIISNHTEASKYAISCATASSDIRKRNWDYNCIYNNTGTYENVTAGSNDITSNPTYTDAANGNYTPTNSALKVAFPETHGGPFGTVVNELWIGAVQPAESAGGISNTVKVCTNIGTY